jgi:hypothetical protein
MKEVIKYVLIESQSKRRERGKLQVLKKAARTSRLANR